MRIDHVAIAVNNLDQAIKNYQKIFDTHNIEVEVVEIGRASCRERVL